MDQTIEEITLLFGSAYDTANEAHATKADYQKRFFEGATEEIAKRRLPQQIIMLPEGEDAGEYVKLYYPGWKQLATSGKNGRQLHLERDPALMKFSYLNQQDQKVYGRTTTGGKLSFNQELLKEKNPNLWEEITEWIEPLASIVREAVDWAGGFWEDREPLQDPDELIHILMHKHKVPRVIRDDLTKEQVDKMRPYFTPTPISIRLVPPREAKPEELEEGQPIEDEE